MAVIAQATPHIAGFLDRLGRATPGKETCVILGSAVLGGLKCRSVHPDDHLTGTMAVADLVRQSVDALADF